MMKIVQRKLCRTEYRKTELKIWCVINMLKIENKNKSDNKNHLIIII